MACLLAGLLHAQESTGKLQGRVQDGAGTPIAQAQVVLPGTAFAGVSDPRGYYFINNIPAGTWSVRAIFLGHRPVEVQGLRILDGQTITQDFSLTATPLQLQEIRVIAAQNVLVPRDEVTTKQRIDGNFVDPLPVDRLEQVLALQPGVVEPGRFILSGGGADRTRGLSIRGGRGTQNAVYIDGVPVQPGYKGDRMYGFVELGSPGTALVIGTNAVEEASVTTGAPSAEFGNATAGIISLVTRTGGSRYRGSFGFETDEPFGVNHGPGFNRLEAGLSGPLADRLTLAVSGVLEGRRSVEEGWGSANFPLLIAAGVDTTVRQVSVVTDDAETPFDERQTADTTIVDVYRYAVSRGRCDQFDDAGAAGVALGRDVAAIQGMRENYGLGCNGVRVPTTPRTLYSVSGKLNYTYGAGSRLSFNLSESRSQGHRFDFIITHYGGRLSSGVSRGFQDRSRLASLTWVHNLSRSAERALALDLSLSYQQDRTIDGPLANGSRLSTLHPWGGFILKPLHFVYDFESFPVDQALIDRIGKGVGESRITPRPGPRVPRDTVDRGAYEVIDLLRNNAYGLYGEYRGFGGTGNGALWNFSESLGLPGRLPMSLYREDRYIGRTSLDWQADRYNRVKLGGEVTQYDLVHYTSWLDAVYPANAFLERPLRWNAFAEDRLDLGDVVIVIGARFDWYRSGASRPYATDTLGLSYHLPRVSSRVDPAHPTATFVQDRAHGYLSPRLQVAFPVTARTNFRFSYAHQVQAPDLGLILSGINGDIEYNGDGQYGSDIDFGKTIAFEFGVRHAFSDDMVLDVAAYNKNVISDPAYRVVTRWDPTSNADVKLNLLTNLDFGTVRGLDVRLDRRIGRFFNGTVAYAYQHARSTGSDPFTYIFYGSFITDPSTGNVQPPPQADFPINDSRPHALTGAFSVTVPHDWGRGVMGTMLRDLSLFSTFRYTSGTAYSRCSTRVDDQNVLSGENCLRQFPEGLNTQRLPPFKELNLRLTKSVDLAGLAVTGYLDVRNLLNFKNVLQVFAVNGNIRNSVEREANLQADLLDLRLEGELNHSLDSTGSLLLHFPHEDCGGWLSGPAHGGRSAPANCLYLIRAEQRYGDGDGIYTVAEQTAAINALYDVARGEHQHVGVGRRARLGVQIDF